MSIDQPKEYTPEEIAEMEESRTISDAELLKGGAEYVIDEEGEKRLEVNTDQFIDKKHEVLTSMIEKEGDLIEIELEGGKVIGGLTTPHFVRLTKNSLVFKGLRDGGNPFVDDLEELATYRINDLTKIITLKLVKFDGASHGAP